MLCHTTTNDDVQPTSQPDAATRYHRKELSIHLQCVATTTCSPIHSSPEKKNPCDEIPALSVGGGTRNISKQQVIINILVLLRAYEHRSKSPCDVIPALSLRGSTWNISKQQVIINISVLLRVYEYRGKSWSCTKPTTEGTNKISTIKQTNVKKTQKLAGLPHVWLLPRVAYLLRCALNQFPTPR